MKRERTGGGLTDRDLLKLCHMREIVNCRHYACWTFAPPVARSGMEFKDADGDEIIADQQLAVLVAAAPVTVILGPDASAADVVRLLTKVADSIAKHGLAADGVLTRQPRPPLHPFLAKHPEIEKELR